MVLLEDNNNVHHDKVYNLVYEDDNLDSLEVYNHLGDSYHYGLDGYGCRD